MCVLMQVERETQSGSQHAFQLLERAAVMDTRAARVPGPLSERLRANADRLRGYADAHDRTRITLTEDAR